uniref:Uncharacterized protein n=1 Tax=Anguilla anguilla TaxID=7936 RepID=A0A0E9U2Z8_ANGAN
MQTASLKEVWLQCFVCKGWAHQVCTPGVPTYICQNCDSCDSDTG